MANYEVAPDKVSTPALSLAAGVEDRVTFTNQYAPKSSLLVHPGSSTTPVWVTVDGSDPHPENGTARPVFAGYALELQPPRVLPTVVRIFSEAAHNYSVEI